MSKEPPLEEMWRSFLMGQNPLLRKGRRLLGLIPSNQRCKNCNVPFDGMAAPLMRLIGRGLYNKNPRFCNF